MTTAVHRTKWFLPLVSLGLGVVFLAALWAGGERGTGLQSLGVMTFIALVLLLGGGARRSGACAATVETSTGSGSTSTRPRWPGTSSSG